jgi:hypothetical protein
MVTLDALAAQVVADALSNEIEHQRRALERVRFGGNAYRGRLAVIETCAQVAQDLTPGLGDGTR